ncbi:MAG: tetratricopeptide repeat protein [Cyanobacteriota bacterium]
MNHLHQLEDVDLNNEKSLKALVRAIRLSQGQFRLILARCNYGALRDAMVQRLRELSPVKIRELVLPKSLTSLYTTIQAELGDEVSCRGGTSVPALMVFGLKSVNNLRTVLTSSNYIREEFSQNFPFPLVLWVNDEVFKKLLRIAPDLESWATSVEFAIATNVLLDFLRQKLDELFTTDTIPTRESCVELEAAWKDLQRRGQGLEPELEASLEFVRGFSNFANDQIDAALKHYQKSLAFWQQRNPHSDAQLYAPTSGLERKGIVLLNIALCYYRKAEQNRAESPLYLENARNYFQQCIDRFEQAQRPDLVAKHISKLGEVLRRLEAWKLLQSLAEKALPLHQSYGDSRELARDYGFLAEVALEQSRWQEANQLAQEALQILSTIPHLQPHERGLYRFLLARSQQHLGHIQESISNLEQGRQESNPQYNPQLYIDILGELRSLYFQQGDYLKAFEIKKEKRLIEYQYNFQAFAGASLLEPKRQVINPTLTQLGQPEIVAQEIAASDREQFVKGLIKRISDNYHKLTVIHGQSGVGKSSIIQAGLVPALRQQAIGERDALPVVLRVYTDWVETLGRHFTEAFENVTGKHLPASVDSTDAIIEQLRENAERNLLTVLIFDQFEEFLFVCKEPAKRQNFYNFLGICLDIPYVKVILSLREDYLHYLLECNRFNNLAVINNNILDKDILCYLGNFSTEEAKLVIESLTNRSQFYLEPVLIEEIVKDLAIEFDSVRPIELQIVGAQLQEEKITTLEQYQRLGQNPKAELVERYLAEVIKDCGSEENRKVAQLVLYLLTDENNTRPLKTKNQLKNDLAAEADKLDLVLEIFVESGLVLHLPGDSVDIYQLVHDYIAALIRHQQGDELRIKLKEWKELKERKKHDQARLNLLGKVLAGSAAVAFALAISTASAVRYWLQARNSESIALCSSFDALSTSNKRDLLDVQIAGLKVGKPLQRAVWAEADTQTSAVSVLQQAVAVFRFTERNRLEHHEGEVRSVAFSPDGKTIATASFDKTVKLWGLDGKELEIPEEHKHNHNGEVRSVAFSPDGKTIATASKDKTAILWSLDGKILHIFAHADELWSVAFSPDGKSLATASDDGSFAIMPLDNKNLSAAYAGHEAAVLSVVWSPDGKTIATASADKTVKLWSLDGKLLQTLQGHKGEVFSVSFSPNGKTIATASGDKTVKLWSLDGKLLQTLQGHEDKVLSATFSPDGKMIATTSVDSTVKLWSTQGKELQTLRGHSSWVWSVAWSPDSQTLATASTDQTVKLWSLGGKDPQILRGHDDKVFSVSFSPDNKTIATASFDKTVKLWNLDGKELQTIKGHQDGVTQVSFSPNSQTFATASFDKTVKLWNLNGKLLQTLKGHNGAVWSVSFSPDGKTIATASFDKTVKLWSLNGKLLQTLKGHDDVVRSVSFSPDGKMIATASRDNTVKIWSTEGQFMRTLEGHNGAVNSVSFSPDGKRIATASADNTVKLWSLDGKLLQILKDHENWVWSVAWSPDSQTLATASGDNTVKLWSLDGKEPQTLRGHDEQVISVSFSPDGKTLASSGFAGRVILWNLKDVGNLDKLLERSCDWVGDYLNNNPNVEPSDRALCDGIGT